MVGQKISIGSVVVLAGSLMANVASAGMANGYNLDLLLFQPHPFANTTGSSWKPEPVVVPALPSQPVLTQRPVDLPQIASISPQQDDSGGVWRLEYGNEDRGILTNVFEPIFDPVFGGTPTDGGMTWGWRISYTPNRANPEWFGSVRQFMPWLAEGATARVSYSLEQDALTPSNLAKADGRTFRPHAGHLAFDARVTLKEDIAPKRQRIDTLDLVVGLVGPASGARIMHEYIHGSINEETDNWDEIKSEPIINLNYEYGQRLFLFETGGAANVEIHPYVGAALGNALTYGSLGLNIRFGKNLFRDLGAPRQRLLLSGENFVDPGDYWAWNVFVGAEGRAMAHSVFLDGNAFRDSQSVDSNVLVYDVQMGFEGGYGAKRFSITNVYRSREFDGQQHTTEFVRVAASMDF